LAGDPDALPSLELEHGSHAHGGPVVGAKVYERFELVYGLSRNVGNESRFTVLKDPSFEVLVSFDVPWRMEGNKFHSLKGGKRFSTRWK
jgi:hypothetical protein